MFLYKVFILTYKMAISQSQDISPNIKCMLMPSFCTNLACYYSTYILLDKYLIWLMYCIPGLQSISIYFLLSPWYIFFFTSVSLLLFFVPSNCHRIGTNIPSSYFSQFVASYESFVKFCCLLMDKSNL